MAPVASPAGRQYDDKPTVLIAGAGIGGLALALFLNKTGQCRVRVFERSSELSPALGGHYGLNGALECLDRAGFGDLWKPLYRPIEKLNILHVREGPKAELNFKRIFRDTPYSERLGTFMRGEFQGALADALPKGVLECGKEVAHVEDLGTSVHVTFADGSSATGDLLIGADGIRSAVRRLVFGEVPLVYSGIKLWWFVSQYSPPESLFDRGVQLDSDNALTMTMSAGTKRQQVIVHAQHAEEPPNMDEVKRDGSLDRFQEICEEEGVYASGLTTKDRLEGGRLLHFGLFNMPAGTSEEQWYRGRVCLLGDAIHATSPFLAQGANQAVQSAYCLARLLDEKGMGSYKAAFHEYYQIRQPATTQIIQNSGNIGRLRVPKRTDSWWQLWRRRIFFYWLPNLFPSFFGWLMARQFKLKV
eukprot:TRINITY_DN9439_c0_g2_i1.p1 TRINITY_DN9439_c0_g2~~TRINITY_DN9439_c0_g2_i1.p1  ORF type:complete len:434 (+),score=36.01 TRINITY_DN9439_c0_g2_i1:56-1303(+)